MRITRVFAILLIAISLILTACSSTASPTPEQMQPKPESPSSEDWAALNRWLDELYGLPPVENTEQLKTAALLVSGLWFEQADKAIKKLEANDIPWERAAPSYLSFCYYVLHDTQLRSASDPIEFMTTDLLLAEAVRDLHDTADELVLMKKMGESFKIFPTEEDARKWFRELDKDWERLMEEAIEKAE